MLTASLHWPISTWSQYLKQDINCCAAFVHVWLASRLAAAWRSALFGARLSNDGPDQDTTVDDFPIYDLASDSCYRCLRFKRHEASPGHGARGLAQSHWRK